MFEPQDGLQDVFTIEDISESAASADPQNVLFFQAVCYHSRTQSDGCFVRTVA